MISAPAGRTSGDPGRPRSDPLVGATVRPARRPRSPLPLVALAVALFAVGLGARLLGLGGAVTEDEDQWIDRSGTFARALATGEWRRTYLTGHPGVTVMWLTTLALGPTRAAELGEAARPATPPGMPTLASGRVPVTTMPDFLAALHVARIPFAVLNAALATLVGMLAWRLLGAGPGLLAGLLLALDPYWAGVGPIVGMDGLLAGFLSASVLSLLLACRAPTPTRALKWTASAGALWGLALLTKTTALFVVPLVPALLLATRLPASRIWRDLRPAALLTVTWGVAGVLAVVLLWPAAWVGPFETAWRAFDFSVRLGGAPHGPGNFFLGRPVDDPGPMFYPVALALRLGPATTLGLIALLLVGAPRRIRFAAWSLLTFVVLFMLLLTVASKKVDRYLLPVLPALDILAGIGWWEATRRMARVVRRRAGGIGSVSSSRVVPSLRPWQAPSGSQAPRRSPVRRSFAALRMTKGGWLLIVVAVGIAALQVWPLLAVGRYPLAAYNPLFGGARAAELAMPVGWGDGLDVAADRIRELGGGAPLTTAIWYPLWVNFQAHAPGPVLTERRLADADVYVDYVHARQRGLTPRQLVGRRPDAVVEIAGVDYARIYRLR